MRMSFMRLLVAAVACVSCTLGAAEKAAFVPGNETDKTAGNQAVVTEAKYVTPERLRFPYLSHYRIEPRVTTKDAVRIAYYVTDWDHRKVRFGDTSERFDVTLRYSRAEDRQNWKTLEQKGVPSGDGAFELGRLPVGDYILSLVCRDRRGLVSRTLWAEFSCVTPESLTVDAKEISAVTAEELAQAGVTAEEPGRYAFVKVEIGDINVPTNMGQYCGFYNKKKAPEIASNLYAKVDACVASAAGKKAVADHPDGYVVFVPARNGEFLFRAYRYSRFVAGAQYDAAKEESLAAANSDGLSRLFADKTAKGFRVVRLPKGVYRLSAAKSVRIPSNLTVDLNGATLKVNGAAGKKSGVIVMDGVNDAVLCNGTVEGNLFEYDFDKSPLPNGWQGKNPEHNFCVRILSAAQRCRIEGVNFRYTVASAVNCDLPDAPGEYAWAKDGLLWHLLYPHMTSAPLVKDWTSDGEGRFKSPDLELKGLADFRWMTVARCLGYQGVVTKSWYYGIEFLDAEKKLLRAETAFQYHRILVPQGARYFRISIETPTVEEAIHSDLSAYWMRVPENCFVRNCSFSWCRTCGLGEHAMYNWLMEGLSFDHCGDESCQCAYDAEDGWDLMQNATFRNIRCHDNPNGDFTICCGHDFVFENCDMGIWVAERGQSTLLRNNTFRRATFDCTWKNKTMYTRFENNRFVDSLYLGTDPFTARLKTIDWEITLTDTELKGTPEKPLHLWVRKTGRLRNCPTENIVKGR